VSTLGTYSVLTYYTSTLLGLPFTVLITDQTSPKTVRDIRDSGVQKNQHLRNPIHLLSLPGFLSANAQQGAASQGVELSLISPTHMAVVLSSDPMVQIPEKSLDCTVLSALQQAPA
jgi:hypothetical protein